MSSPTHAYVWIPAGYFASGNAGDQRDRYSWREVFVEGGRFCVRYYGRVIPIVPRYDLVLRGRGTFCSYQADRFREGG